MSLTTPWGEALDPTAPLPEYPRPQLVRENWLNLNGIWDYAFTYASTDPLGADDPTKPPHWDGDIVVPFSPEVPLSGVNRQIRPNHSLWYHRRFIAPAHGPQDRVLLHFGAVDQTCRIAVDGIEVGGHTGGYLPFTLDITSALTAAGDHDLVVSVRDVTDSSWLSRGKQSSKPGGIWYTPQSGIWQTVWLEVVDRVGVDGLVLVPDPSLSSVSLTVLSDNAPATLTAQARVLADGEVVATQEVQVGHPCQIAIPDARLWTPETPFLYDVEVSLGADRVRSYFGMRSFGVGRDESGHARLLLNGEFHLPVGLLDQGYWPDGGYTAPSDEALIFDIELAKRLGFNMLRKHIKIEPLRWYHHCDRLGMLVWQDAVSGGSSYNKIVISAPAVRGPQLSDKRYWLFGRRSAAGRKQFESELREMVSLLRNAVSVSLWVPFNEGWGQFDAARIARLVRELDPSRPIDHASGWHDQHAGDLRSLHVYFRRFKAPRGRDPRVLALTEFGGYSLPVRGHTWSKKAFGYRKFASPGALFDALAELYCGQILLAIPRGLAATVYTQLSDVEDEINGLVTYDRRVVKVDERVFRKLTAELHRAERTLGRPPMPAV